MSCDDSFPVFLLYDSGKLTGFGWAMIADLVSTRVEHPTPNTFKVSKKGWIFWTGKKHNYAYLKREQHDADIIFVPL